MAIVSPEYVDLSGAGVPVNDAVMPRWALAAGDVGTPVKIGQYSDRTVHFYGTFAGSALALRGSNMQFPDPENDSDWFLLTDPKQAGSLSNIQENSGFVIYENPLWVSPKCSGGAATLLFTSILGRKK